MRGELAIEARVVATRPHGADEPPQEPPKAAHHSSSFARKPIDETRRALPPGRLLGERTCARPRDRVVLGLAVVLGGLPGPFDPALLLQADERGIERALIQPDGLLGDLLDPGGDAVGVLRAHGGERSQHDELEGAGEQVGAPGLSTW